MNGRRKDPLVGLGSFPGGQVFPFPLVYLFVSLADLVLEYVTHAVHLLTQPKRLAGSSGALNAAAAPELASSSHSFTGISEQRCDWAEAKSQACHFCRIQGGGRDVVFCC